jgi:hypothetical protein
MNIYFKAFCKSFDSFIKAIIVARDSKYSLVTINIPLTRSFKEVGVDNNAFF